MNRRHLAATILLPLGTTVVLTAYLLIVRDRLPDQVAVHWGPAGEADGFVSRNALAPIFGGLIVVIGALLAAISLSSSRAIGGRPLVGIANGIAWFVAALAVATTSIQLDGGDGTDLPGWSIPVAIGAAAAGWGLAMGVAGAAPTVGTTDQPGPADAARLHLPADHTAIWHGSTPLGRGPAILAAVTIVVGLALAAATSWWLLAAFLPAALAVLASASYRVSVGPGMVAVSGVPLGFPRVRVPLAQITRADAGTVRAWSFGGWGLRIGKNDESAVITRSGPALVVTRTDGAVLRVSLDRPEDAAATITSLLDRRGGAQPAEAETAPC